MTKNKINTLSPFANKLSCDCRRFRGGPVPFSGERRYKGRHLLAHTRQSIMAGKVYGVPWIVLVSLGADV
jgi:hypothetical protein